jgi:CRISPR-associated endonuclease/helicase Cas3
MPPFFAHSGIRPDYSDWQDLREHLRGVAEKARDFACACASLSVLEEMAYAAGLQNDLGKYRPEFQEYIRE